MVIDLSERRRSLAVPVLPDTSHEAIQRYVMDKLAIGGGVLFAEGHWWERSAIGAWVPMPEARIWSEIQAINGLETLEGSGGKNGGKCIRVNAGMCTSVEALARARFGDSNAFADSAVGFVTPAGVWSYSVVGGWSSRAPSPEDRVRMWVNVDPDLDPDHDPMEWFAVLHRMWGAEPDYKERCWALHEFLGALLMGTATKYQKAPILLGDGENGKSVIVEVLMGCVPANLRCSVTPEDLENNRFASSNLVGKALNAVAELPGSGGELLTSHRIKSIIDGSEQGAEKKGKDGFTFRPIAGHLFAANGLPRVRDLSHGFWRRWMLLTCPAPKISAEERKFDLAASILAAEMPQIIGLALRCYATMVSERRGYTDVPSSADAIRAWRGESDSVQAWVEDATEPGGPSAFRGLYEHYKRHAEDNGARPVGSKTFATRLDALGIRCVCTAAARMRPLAVKVGP